MTDDIQRSALISADGQYRYLLERKWVGADLLSSHTTATFVMLNPSTADGTKDDPTIRRCMRFARDWGHGALQVINLFGLRATSPAELIRPGAPDPVGPDNDQAIADVLARVRPDEIVVAAWGAHPATHRETGVVDHRGRPRTRAEVVADMAAEHGVVLHCLTPTKGGSPSHPLYQPATAVPVPWGGGA